MERARVCSMKGTGRPNQLGAEKKAGCRLPSRLRTGFGEAQRKNRNSASMATRRVREIFQVDFRDLGRKAVGLALGSCLLVSSPAGLAAETKAPQMQPTAPLPSVDLDLKRYTGTWYEVASLKKGFAGEGQQDCHCTAGLYTFDEKKSRLSVKTFCVHGSPTGKISGIEGRVSGNLKKEKGKSVFEECMLTFPSIPFIPPEPYQVLDTDYDNFALVQGAKDLSFVQIYSRTPNPGKAFIDKQKKYLEQFGYKASDIRDTPQDCSEGLMNKMNAMMKSPDMVSVFQNTAGKSVEQLVSGEEDLDGIVLQGPRNPVEEATDLLDLFKMFSQKD
mmetsp:Transcript_10397/g.26393  ORF Transcript_10397/g.26393 Transcript_10397/m.26393 type:complete len:331 (+) Transcript_10397:58-1050(+)